MTSGVLEYGPTDDDGRFSPGTENRSIVYLQGFYICSEDGEVKK